jgi:hypothetical protein
MEIERRVDCKGDVVQQPMETVYPLMLPLMLH